jgi:signal transduction histidine kinase
MAEILLEVCELLGKQAQQKHQSLKVDIQDRPLVIADRQHLRAIWMNLISNAIKYTPEGGDIEVQLSADAYTATGIVTDSGIGIGAEDVPKLFHEFFRTDEAKASAEIGTGLGLSIVKQIVDSYHGQIEVLSKPNQGSRFTFTLPLKPD